MDQFFHPWCVLNLSRQNVVTGSSIEPPPVFLYIEPPLCVDGILKKKNFIPNCQTFICFLPLFYHKYDAG